ncbi:MAG: HIT domain-containing protein [Acidobacteria bacterium]|nr:HIT domain-containing protein [Acidobacteriota bacterium]MBU4308018.1 HIT domain-containing protein [Acidobacteriota bacterium]
MMKYLSAPWRWEFISNLKKDNSCVFCQALTKEDHDSLVCFRGNNFLVILNKYPYSTGHLLIAPNAHIAAPEDMTPADLLEMWQLTNRSLTILKESFHPDGFNIGMNIGKAAGAGVKDHFHQHIVPRWQGDANFMAVVGDTKLLSYDLETVFSTIRSAFAK